MKLVEAEATGPVEGDDALVTPPRLPHRRVSVSLLFTLTVLVGTVVAIYMTFPNRNNVLLTEGLERHRDQSPTWDLAAPTASELRAWAIGVVGTDVPLPAATASIVGARRIEILNRHAAVIQLRIGSDDVTYLVQHVRGLTPERTERTDGDVRAVGWRHDAFACVAVGPDRTAPSWLALFN